MVIGSFAIVTLLGGRGDRRHDIAGYRGLAMRQPWVAFAFAVLLLAQAGAPFTTGLWAKLQVVSAAVDANSVPLAVIAMVSAAVAAFFYLRVAVLMYTPLRAAGSTPGLEVANDGDALVVGARLEPLVPSANGAGGAPANGSGDGGQGALLWAGSDRAAAAVGDLNAELLMDDDPATAVGTLAEPVVASAVGSPAPEQAGSDLQAAEPAGRVRIPALSALAIGLCVAVTVVFGIIPGPLVDFAHQASLLFLP
jgi:NADH:ubiquinone oxidoreductase subunit 2 (subunit N)